ncbi:hypothetical protein [Xanthobacter aminoxidans]|uniref:hypothetical protein n=1 Tax=Xanthobacter aminoxidans TaxID=186280 RepID=UPI002023125A|nr:hypothetical protein [Xanthobacter aminoxidans]MCL8384133.1 hypothetical protein [Xanthobacter aminoxidans]
MKRFLIAALAVAGLTLAGCEDGSYFNANTKQLKSDKVGRLEASGDDLRVYEFTPQSDPTKQCVFVAGDKKGGLVCFDKRRP